MTIVPRGKRRTLYLSRRVPARYRAVEPRRRVWISLKTDSMEEARRRAAGAWDQQCAAWEALRAGDTTEAVARFEAAREIAQAHGMRYLPAEAVARLPLAELRERIEAAMPGGRFDRVRTPALLGAVPRPAVTVTQALELYWPLADDRLVGKSADQVRRWKNPRIKAVRSFVEVVGDRALEEITADDMLDWREALLERVKAGAIIADSANKDLGHLADVLTTVNKGKRLNLAMPLRGWRLKVGEKRTRPAFSTAWIVTRLLAPGALDGMNPELRDLVLASVNTGARPSELQVLGPGQVRLGAEVPHVSIEPVGRTLKTRNARRTIPLLGMSLEAMRRRPEGFPRYAGAADVTNAVNQYLSENGLRERPDTTFYSLRHAFQDRMVSTGVDDRVRRDLFGHALTEERYGAVSLAVKARALARVALHRPPSVG